MTIARSIQINLNNTPYYHCISRCVRQAYLCGTNYETGQSYDHRKQWVIDRIKYLSSQLCIQICAYAMMATHYHLVLFVNQVLALSLTDAEVIARWEALCPNSAKLYHGVPLTDPIMQNQLALWRHRLTDISWFMQMLNQHIAKQANKEDKCRGRFWEGRFISQALLDESALLSAMAYVDLNPIRAGIAKTPETSEFTSIYERIKYIAKQRKTQKMAVIDSNMLDSFQQPPGLMPFANNKNLHNPSTFINFQLSEYLRLVDMTGRSIHEGKRGKIPANCSKILTRLNFSTEGWIEMVNDLESKFSFAIGDPDLLTSFASSHLISSPKGISTSRRIYMQNAA